MSESETVHSVQLHTGRSIPILGLGTSPMRGRKAYEAVRFALGAGYRLIDTATSYHNQQEVGRAIRDSGLAREEIFVTTKVPGENAGRERPTLEESLAQLGMDHVDLWLIHSPPGRGPGVEMWRALLQLREEGKARDVGVSNYSPAQLIWAVHLSSRTRDRRRRTPGVEFRWGRIVREVGVPGTSSALPV